MSKLQSIEHVISSDRKLIAVTDPFPKFRCMIALAIHSYWAGGGLTE